MKAGAAALIMLAAACGNKEPTIIDGSSKESFVRTTEQARRDIPDADRLDYDTALKNPPGKSFGDSEAEVTELARQTYNGMTAEQVIDGR